MSVEYDLGLLRDIRLHVSPLHETYERLIVDVRPVDTELLGLFMRSIHQDVERLRESGQGG